MRSKGPDRRGQELRSNLKRRRDLARARATREDALDEPRSTSSAVIQPVARSPEPVSHQTPGTDTLPDPPSTPDCG